MVSNIDTAKKAWVTLLKSLAVIYGVATGLERESTDEQVPFRERPCTDKAACA